MMQIKLQYCRAVFVILIFSPFNTQPTRHILKLHLNLLHFPLYFGKFYFGKKMSIRAFSHILQVCTLWTTISQILCYQNLLKHLNKVHTLHATQNTFPPQWTQPPVNSVQVAESADDSQEELHYANHFHWNNRCHCRSSEVVTHWTLNKALLLLLLSSCIYNLWISSHHELEFIFLL